MKRILSLLLIAVLFLVPIAAAPTAATAEEGFQEGDVLYLRIESPSNWAQNATLYANFSAISRADNGDRSIVIAEADPALVHPVQGLVYDASKGMYRYLVTAQDAGATQMRFWRGNEEKLWNNTVLFTAADYAAGMNTVVVTDWTDAGYLETTYDFDLDAELELSQKTASVGDTIAIKVHYAANKSANVACELYLDDALVSEAEEYTFIPEADGVYRVTAKLTATHFSTGALMSRDEVSATVIVGTTPMLAFTPSALFAHASRGSKDREAWVRWYSVDGTYYLFLPSSIKRGEPVELYSSYEKDATLDTLTVPAHGIFELTPDPEKEYVFRYERTTRTVVFLYSNAESALFINNLEDYNGADFFTYLKADKENSVAASGAYTHRNGTVTDVGIKKMKGRGNTSWNADKKGFNVTFQDAITLDGMEKCKKFSLISNFQDAALLRNRILYDLSDAVGVPYASDSRMIDLYTNGVYQGSYQMCQKIEVGKNALITDFGEADYYDAATGGVKPDFAFVAEIDASPAADDFHFTVDNGCNLTIKSPELDSTDQNIAAVRDYIRNKFNTMFDKLNENAADVGDYIDLDSLAKVYLINELGKNWDSGATSFFLTYKQDENGSYKFFASPVWDYDNSLGNANGVERDLRNMGVTDYTLPTGWFSTKKNGYAGPNFLAVAAKHDAVMEQVYQVWFEDFVPALEILTKTGVTDGELYSADAYYKITKDSAEMNYRIWALVTNTSWIADHSRLQNWGVTYTYNAYGQITGADAQPYRSVKQYDQYTYEGQFDYMIDWTTSRAAWISGQYIAHYHPEPPAEPTEPPTEPADPEKGILGDVNRNEEVDILDATMIQRYLVALDKLDDRQKAAADTNRNGEVDIVDATYIQRLLAGLLDAF